MKSILFRAEDNFIESIKMEANQKGLSQNELIKKALEHFFICDKAEEIPSLREIITKYKGSCSKCSRTINMGERALYGKTKEGSILICLDCQIGSESDKTIVRRLLKLRKLDREIKALQNQKEQLLREYEELELKADFANLLKNFASMRKAFVEFQSWANYTQAVKGLKLDDLLKRLDVLIGYADEGLKIIREYKLKQESFLKNKIKRRT